MEQRGKLNTKWIKKRTSTRIEAAGIKVELNIERSLEKWWRKLKLNIQLRREGNERRNPKNMCELSAEKGKEKMGLKQITHEN